MNCKKNVLAALYKYKHIYKTVQVINSNKKKKKLSVINMLFSKKQYSKSTFYDIAYC